MINLFSYQLNYTKFFRACSNYSLAQVKCLSFAFNTKKHIVSKQYRLFLKTVLRFQSLNGKKNEWPGVVG